MDDYQHALATIVNRGVTDTGFGRYHQHIIAIGGLGWFFDNFWMFAISLVSLPLSRQYSQNVAWTVLAKYVGLTLGCTLWPLAADHYGRLPVFNWTILGTAVCGIVASMCGPFMLLCFFLMLVGFNTGGNQPVASMLVVESVPASHQHWLLYESVAWGLGSFTAAMIGWPIVANNTCDSVGECLPENNSGWRYAYFVFGVFTMAMYGIRSWFTIYESAKFVALKGDFGRTVAILNNMAAINQTPTTTVTISELEQVWVPPQVHTSTVQEWLDSKKEQLLLLLDGSLSRTTVTLWLIWGLCGTGYPLFSAFLPIYLNLKASTLDQTYRDYAIQAVFSIPSGYVAGQLAQHPKIGRKGLGAVGGILTGVFMYLFILSNPSTDVWISGYLVYNCCISFVTTLLYGALYAYTPEVFPIPVRAIGTASCSFWNRACGLLGPVIALTMKIESGTPVFLSGALFITAGIMFLMLPVETRGRAAL